MADEILRNASLVSDPLFNLLSIRQKYLFLRKPCCKCKSIARMWSIISVCHDYICYDCWHPDTKITRCPSCYIKFDYKKDSITADTLRTCFSQTVAFTINVLALESNESGELYAGSTDGRKVAEGVNLVNKK